MLTLGYLDVLQLQLITCMYMLWTDVYSLVVCLV